jgi:hypothetical protein
MADTELPAPRFVVIRQNNAREFVREDRESAKPEETTMASICRQA